jgi:hypothetical protein
MKKKYVLVITIICLGMVGSLFSPALSQEKQDAPLSPADKLMLGRAVMCEGIRDYKPENVAVVFSVTIGKVSCFTAFDVVPEQTVIYHKWFFKDKPSTEKRLTLQPPKWASYSSIQLRETDKGPWRVEIFDQENNLLHTVRFSITD